MKQNNDIGTYSNKEVRSMGKRIRKIISVFLIIMQLTLTMIVVSPSTSVYAANGTAVINLDKVYWLQPDSRAC